MTQKEMILEHLKQRGSITPLEALNFYGCMRLSARIAELRADGYRIETEMVTKNRKQYAKYYLVKEGD